MIYYLSEGLKNAEENYFVGFERKELQKDYVDVISCVFKTWNRKKSEWMEREAYLDSENSADGGGTASESERTKNER